MVQGGGYFVPLDGIQLMRMVDLVTSDQPTQAAGHTRTLTWTVESPALIQSYTVGNGRILLGVKTLQSTLLLWGQSPQIGTAGNGVTSKSILFFCCLNQKNLLHVISHMLRDNKNYMGQAPT